MSSAVGIERRDVSFDSWGERCAAWLYRPPGVSGRPPLVILAHGWTGVREQGLDRYAERFAQAGLGALVFDYRHFGSSGGEPRGLLDVGRQLADWAAAIAYARTLEDFDSERIALWGTSFSGGHVLATASRDHRIAAVVAQVPFVDGRTVLRATGLSRSLMMSREGLRDLIGAALGRPPHMIAAVAPPGGVAAMTTPDAEPGFRSIDPPHSTWVNESAARAVLSVGLYRPGIHPERVTCPLLVCVAEEDAITPPGPAVRLAERSPRGQLRRYPVGHFGLYVGDTFERAVADQVEFLRAHLDGGASAAEPAS